MISQTARLALNVVSALGNVIPMVTSGLVYLHANRKEQSRIKKIASQCLFAGAIAGLALSPFITSSYVATVSTPQANRWLIAYQATCANAILGAFEGVKWGAFYGSYNVLKF